MKKRMQYGQKNKEQFNLRSQMAQSVLKTVIASYKAILENQKEWTKPNYSKPQLDLVWNRDYSLDKKQNLFSVNTLEGRIKVKFYNNGFEQYFTDNCKFGTAKLVFKHNKFFLHIPVTYQTSEQPRNRFALITDTLWYHGHTMI